jgi:cytochrome c553
MGRGHMGHRGMMMGMSGPVPWLDGQHADYLVDQLDRFARGERASQPMADIAAALSARDRRAVALYLAARR